MSQLRSSIRFLLKNRLFSIINLIGLVIGFTTIILITIWIKNELSYDTFHKNHVNIYRLTVEVNNPSGYHSHFARNWQVWTRQMPGYFSDIENIALFAPLRSTDIKMHDIKFTSNRVFYCNPDVLEVFDITVLSGNAKEALKEPNMILISESLFTRYFKDISLADTTIQMAGAFDTEFKDYHIAGIFKNFPSNSHFHPEILISFDDLENFNGWAYTYFKLSNGISPSRILENFHDFADEHINEKEKDISNIHFQPISEIHLFSQKDREIEKNGDIKVVWIFSAIGIIVFLIVLINFINLNLVILLKRNRVFILKKILGSGFWNIARSIILETIILISVAGLISFILIILSLPILGSLYTKEILSESFIFLIPTYFVLISISLIITLIPQLLFILNLWLKLSHFNSAKSDQSNLLKSNKLGFRKIFVIIQFIASIVLISSAYYIDLQEKYLWNNRMAFQQESVIVLKELNWKKRGKYHEFKNRLQNSHLIKDITASMEPPSGFFMDAMGVDMEGLPDEEDISIFVFPIEENFYDFYKIPIIAGEDFSAFFSDINKEEYILNESAVKHLGFEKPEDAIGRQFKLNFSIDSLFKGGEIKGVVKDFNLSPLFEKVKPLVMFQKPIWYSTILIKVDSSNKKESIQYIKNVWDEINPEYVFDYSFDDELYQAAYHNEILQSKLSKFLTFLAIIIASMGLFGISTFVVQLKTKEISIRKINGALSTDIYILLSKDFLQWVIVSIIIAAPISWYMLKTWSENYPYKVELSWWIFLLAGAMALVFALISISYITIKAARQNPVETLRYE